MLINQFSKYRSMWPKRGYKNEYTYYLYILDMDEFKRRINNYRYRGGLRLIVLGIKHNLRLFKKVNKQKK